MHRDGASLAVTVDERVLAPSLLVRTYAAAAYHLSHCSKPVIEPTNINKCTFSLLDSYSLTWVGCKHNGGLYV